MSENEEYRVALILSESRQLLGIKTTGLIALPRINIPMWSRPAQHLTQSLLQRWKLKTIVLDILYDNSFTGPCAIIEVRSFLCDQAVLGLVPVSLDMIEENSLGAGDRATLQTLLQTGKTNRGPFSRLGWIDEAQTWIAGELACVESSPPEDVQQLNAGAEFCLARFISVTGQAYWLKAVGEPNTHEFSITQCLAKLCPTHLPPIVASRTDWNAWLMREVGTSLHGSQCLLSFERAVASLAELQRELIGKTDDLISAQCGDHRNETLGGRIDEIIDYLIEAMGVQMSTKAPPLTSNRLRKLGQLLHETCSEMQSLDIPDSIIHNDISPGTILLDTQACVFTDWCEAYVGNPFITFEQLRVHASNNDQVAGEWSATLRNRYRSSWSGVLTDRQIDRAFQLAPLMAVLSYLYGRGSWLRSPMGRETQVQSYARSLARHMDKIAVSQNLLEAQCL
jgi:hypothetical protein